MKKIADILAQLLLIAKDAKAWMRVLIFVVVGTGCVVVGAIAFSKTRTRVQDCTYYIEQNKQLVGALIEIRTDLQPKATSFIGGGASIIFALYRDTIPKPKMSAQVNKVLNKIDSILLKIKQDSLNFKNKKS